MYYGYYNYDVEGSCSTNVLFMYNDDMMYLKAYNLILGKLQCCYGGGSPLGCCFTKLPCPVKNAQAISLPYRRHHYGWKAGQGQRMGYQYWWVDSGFGTGPNSVTLGAILATPLILSCPIPYPIAGLRGTSVSLVHGRPSFISVPCPHCW